MDFTDHRELRIESEESRYRVRCYAASLINTANGTTILSALIAGPEQLCVGVFSSFVQAGHIIAYDGKMVSKCEFFYRRQASPIVPFSTRWQSLLILSKDKRCLWQDDDEGLIMGLKKVTETPFLDSWIGYIRQQLTDQSLLTKFSGHNARGSYLSVTSEQLDAIVCDGVKSGELNIRG